MLFLAHGILAPLVPEHMGIYERDWDLRILIQNAAVHDPIKIQED
jgi:hypothetical protein